MHPAPSSFNERFYSDKQKIDHVFRGFRKSSGRIIEKISLESSDHSQTEQSSSNYVTVMVKVNGCYEYKRLYCKSSSQLD